MRILFIGDVVAKPGRNTVKEVLPEILSNDNIDLVVANAENIAHGRGITRGTIQELIEAGVNYFTGGDHVFWQAEAEDYIDELPLVRPANYPEPAPGKGYSVVGLNNGQKVLLINLMGRTSFSSTNSYLEDPFRTADKIIEQNKENVNAIIVDFHAEATSEKNAFGLYLDGKVDAILGTHTHVPTCDNRVLPNGTMYVTDVGMTGIVDAVIGVKKDIIINLCLTARNQRFEWETQGRRVFNSVLLDTEKKTITRADRYV